mgnify:CR=1 FL=1
MRRGYAVFVSLIGCSCAQAATFSVSNINDAGDGSLRQAILAPTPSRRITATVLT